MRSRDRHMKSRIQKFKELASRGNLRLALLQTFDFIQREFYSKIGLTDFIRSRLLIGGPAFPLHTIWVLFHRDIIGVPRDNQESVMEKDWDNLVLLDSYRQDFFRKHSSIEGEFSTVISQGSWSLEFVVNNFQDSQFHDTVVVTSNPYYQRYNKIDSDTFHDLIYCPKTEGRKSFDEVIKKAIEANQEYPNKRLLIHVMKPHTPHIGKTSAVFKQKFGGVYPGMFPLFESGIITRETLKKSYHDTISEIEPEIKTLLDELDGKSVVSSDHG